MNKTLIISDLHLQGSYILKDVDKIIDKEKITRVIMMGDYFDQWNQTAHDALFISESEFLMAWAEKHRNKREVICLLGNHDIPYITGNLRHYSNNNEDTIKKLKACLFQIQAQVCVEADGYIISHAGFVGEHKPEGWHQKPIENTNDCILKLDDIETHVGPLRGGYHRYGSMVWADLHELINHYNKDYPKQIVSHSPVQHVTNFNDLWAVDTMSLNFNYQFIGDASMVILENGKVKVIETDIQSNVEHWK